MSRQYHVGTLTYSPTGIALLFTWMLWGGFCYSMLAYVLIPTLLPLTLNKFGASGALTGLIVGSIPAAMNMVMNPVLGTNSDRTRTRWGRRIPYLTVAAPFVTLFMILIGWSPELAGWLHRHGVGGTTFSEGVLGIALICIFSVLFQFFNLIVGSIYYYVFADVVPHQFMGRFMSMLNIMMAAAGFFFNFFILKYAKSHMAWIYTGVGLLFFVSFILLCTQVKEGTYPPPETLTNRDAPLASRVKTWLRGYFSQCFGTWFFSMLFLGTALNQVSTACRTIFNLLFAVKELHLSEAQFGHIMGVASLVGMGVIAITGYIMDKVHPLRVYFFSGILVIMSNIFGYWWVNSYATFFVTGIVIVVVYSVQSLSNIPMFVALFPADCYGQFSSANAMLNCVLMVVANWCGGLAIDHFGYRFIFIWDTIFTALATLAVGYVYYRWKKNNYQAPSLAIPKMNAVDHA